MQTLFTIRGSLFEAFSESCDLSPEKIQKPLERVLAGWMGKIRQKQLLNLSNYSTQFFVSVKLNIHYRSKILLPRTGKRRLKSFAKCLRDEALIKTEAEVPYEIEIVRGKIGEADGIDFEQQVQDVA